MIKLYQFNAAFGIPSASPFCVKTEILLKMSGVTYEVVWHNDPRRSPKGKLPFIEINGRKIGDSTLIRYYLEEEHNVTFDEHLSAEERAIADGFTKLVEEHLYWTVIYSRWLDNANWPRVRARFFNTIPKPMRGFVAKQVRKQTRQHMKGQGIGRHSADEIYQMGIRDLASIANYLDDKSYFMGDQLSTADASIYPFLAVILESEFMSPLRIAADRHERLQPYCERIRGEFFPDFDPKYS